jgi:hypothetical protein
MITTNAFNEVDADDVATGKRQSADAAKSLREWSQAVANAIRLCRQIERLKRFDTFVGHMVDASDNASELVQALTSDNVLLHVAELAADLE